MTEMRPVRDDFERFFVLTGGPGSGKSTLIDALESVGFARSVESGRAIIQAQLAIRGRALPWSDPAAFAELMLSWDMRSYHMAQNENRLVFFDRGVPDVVGYLRLLGLPVPPYMERAAELFPYNQRVFIAPPWAEIFEQDCERTQDFDEAVRTSDAMVDTYAGYGYELIELPRAPVDERIRFVLQTIGIAAPARARPRQDFALTRRDIQP